jgi:hypothetical protein
VRVVPDEHPVGAVYPFEFVSFVERIDPWRVSGIDIETRMWTEIKGPIEVGDRVKVEGWILPDGIWLADEIKLTGERDALFFEFVGRVRSIEPWIVGGIPLTVDHRTEMKGPIGVGDRVKVEGWILPDNVWLATEIKRVEEGLGRGCMQFTALVVRVDADRVVLENGATISLEDAIPIVGELKINSVIVFIICIDDEGNMIVVSILVLYQLEPAIIVHPTSAPPEPPAPEPTRRRPSPPGGGGSIVVTENNQTRTFTCNGHSVTIRGNDNAITLLGNCGPVTVRGNNNWVSIQSASSVTNTGNNNTIVGR